MGDHIVYRSGKGSDGTVDLSQRMIRKSEFGKRLLSLLTKKGWNQSDLAKTTGLGRDSVSTYIRGKSVPTYANLTKLAEALDVKPEELYPNYEANSAALEEPIFALKQVNDDTNKMWLTVNMKIDTEKAIAVMKILNNKDDNS